MKHPVRTAVRRAAVLALSCLLALAALPAGAAAPLRAAGPALQAENGVLESNFYCGNYYGTVRFDVEKRLAAGKVVVLVIDVNGAASIKRLCPQATTVFICPPSEQELEKRLRGRGTESEDKVRERLARAKEELALADTYDARLVNEKVEECAGQLYQLIHQLNREGITIIMVSHDLAGALPYASHILHLGQQVWYGTKEDYLKTGLGNTCPNGKEAAQ